MAQVEAGLESFKTGCGDNDAYSEADGDGEDEEEDDDDDDDDGDDDEVLAQVEAGLKPPMLESRREKRDCSQSM